MTALTGQFEVTYLSTSGVGSLVVQPGQLVLAGRRTVRSLGATFAAGALALILGFVVAVMWQDERWPPLALGILTLLAVGCGVLLVHAKRVEPFRWVVPWRDVASITETSGDGVQWQVTVKGRHAGPLPFAVLAGRHQELAELLLQVHESGLAKVRFRERELPEAVLLRP